MDVYDLVCSLSGVWKNRYAPGNRMLRESGCNKEAQINLIFLKIFIMLPMACILIGDNQNHT